jgi:hypothetical protein
MAEKIEIKQQDKSREEYLLILDAFRRMVYNYENNAERWEVFDDIITLRASFLIDRALSGLRIDFDRALEILQNNINHLTAREETERNTLLAAIDNLIDFAAAEETALMSDLPEELDLADMEIYEDTCRKYNETYAETENGMVYHAAAIAAWWIATSAETLITFNTQGDERVRPWHLSFDGISYPKSEFPPELIPPIEWGCRCFLTSNGFASVYGALQEADFKGKVNPVFAESLAKGGRIFSPAHPHFSLVLPVEVERIKQRLKAKFGIVCPQ